MTDRVAILRAGYARTAAMAEVIRAAADNLSIVLVRVLPATADEPRRVLAYNGEFMRVWISTDAGDAVDLVLRASRPTIDWSIGHDWNLSTGNLRRSPGVGERGHEPQTEYAFGGTPPVFLVDAVPEAAA